jgi:DNA uptake protein ComE-like DNA-binding protein
MKLKNLYSILLTLALALLASGSIANAESALVDANSAATEEIAALPHMDEVLAEVVVANRPFVTIGELHDLLSADLDEEQLEEL